MEKKIKDNKLLTKKDCIFNIRMNNDLKNEFLNITKIKSENRSVLLRHYIKNYIKKNKLNLNGEQNEKN